MYIMNCGTLTAPEKVHDSETDISLFMGYMYLTFQNTKMVV